MQPLGWLSPFAPLQLAETCFKSCSKYSPTYATRSLALLLYPDTVLTMGPFVQHQVLRRGSKGLDEATNEIVYQRACFPSVNQIISVVGVRVDL